ncbi:MAG: RecX family transcriptional regulator [Chloroflexi bacterium]|nr:RecX family transcriptional regulator [Chloroflexota bacterium]MBI3733412.1 RecX family transcriptional regulator [Chloroflexota bacterium]
MDTITALSPQQKNPQRVSVYINAQFAFGLAAIVAARLKVGQAIGAEEVARLRALDEAEEAYNKSLGFLSYRPRSRAELERYLKDKGVSEGARAQVLERLARLELVNDRSFAQYWVENRETFGPRGKRALRQELRQKGVSDEQVQEAIGSVDEPHSAYEAGQKRAMRMASLDREIFYRRLSGFLQRRGFGYEVVKTTVARLWGEYGATNAPEPDEREG